jgi:hypothetical protein
MKHTVESFVSLLTNQAHRKTDNVYGRILFSELHYSGIFFLLRCFDPFLVHGHPDARVSR